MMLVKSLRWITVRISDILSIVYTCSYCVSLNAWFKHSWYVVHWNMYILCYICRFKTYTYIRRASTCINFPLKVVVAVPPPLPPTSTPRPRVTYGLFSPTKQSLIPIYSKTIRETIHVHPPIIGRLCSIFLHTCISTLTYSFVFSLGI